VTCDKWAGGQPGDVPEPGFVEVAQVNEDPQLSAAARERLAGRGQSGTDVW
jgi:hypothetical protein